MESAEDFLKEGNEGHSIREVVDGLMDDQIIQVMVDFARHHVKLALQKAAENADITYRGEKTWDFIFVDKSTILNAYPLINIK